MAHIESLFIIIDWHIPNKKDKVCQDINYRNVKITGPCISRIMDLRFKLFKKKFKQGIKELNIKSIMGSLTLLARENP